MNNLELSAQHVGTHVIDFVADYCNGARELLVSAHLQFVETSDIRATIDSASEVRGQMIDELLCDCNGYDSDRLPFVAIELEAAIESLIDNFCVSRIATIDDECESRFWFRLSW